MVVRRKNGKGEQRHGDAGDSRGIIDVVGADTVRITTKSTEYKRASGNFYRHKKNLRNQSSSAGEDEAYTPNNTVAPRVPGRLVL